MDILESIEVRWFLQDDPAAAGLLNWFDASESEGMRTDRYLVTGRGDIGFKARLPQGKPAKIETKYLLGSLGLVELAANVVGALERWQKLSLEVNDPALHKQGIWVSVDKIRRLRKFAWTEDGLKEVVPSKNYPAAGAGFELTTLGGDSRISGYTLGIEAFGPPTRLLAILQSVCRAVFSERLELRLDREASMSYYTWLSRLPQPRGWTHAISVDAPYYDDPAQGRPPNGIIPAGTPCVISSEDGSFVRVSAKGDIVGYVSADALVPR